MFTGLVEASAAVRRASAREQGLRIWVAEPAGEWSVSEGQSIAISGACLSLAAGADPHTGEVLERWRPGADMVFDLSAETLHRTWFGAVRAGTRVNLERALCLGDRLDGHLVSGHVDGQGRVVSTSDSKDGGRLIEFEIEPSLTRYLIEKGSLTIDGVSLTVVSPRGARFSVAVIPITLEKTTLSSFVPGQSVNIEADMIGKWIERLLPR